jgi:hypothetical protein
VRLVPYQQFSDINITQIKEVPIVPSSLSEWLSPPLFEVVSDIFLSIRYEPFLVHELLSQNEQYHEPFFGRITLIPCP